ncbi:MAG: hypothetical protein JWQ32_2860 [Marmoricola sp.]|nr:hypothetical protein [Marmoricola sp.]
MSTLGIVLAAGSGTRMGCPKALVDGWLPHSVAVLSGGGCDSVLVVLGASADEARPILADLGATVVVCENWAAGMSRSLSAGLRAATGFDADVAVVTLVDLPDLVPSVVTRVLHRLGTHPGALGRATYHGQPGHPVVLGSSHWEPILAETRGDRGARDYLERVGAIAVECGDLAGGGDVDNL